MSNSLWPHGLQHARPPCPSPTPRVYSNSCPLSPWCHPTISSSVVPFFPRLQSFPVSESFPMSQLFASGGQSIGVSTSASVLPMNIQDWFPLGWTGWISLQSKGLSRVFFSTTVQKHQFFGAQPFFWSDSHHLNCISNVCNGQRDHCFVLRFQRTETVNLCVAAPWFVIGITRATTAFLFPDISLNFSFL